MIEEPLDEQVIQPGEQVGKQIAADAKSTSVQAKPSGPTAKPTRPPGEIGGHTVQPGEEQSQSIGAGASSRATPPPTLPEEGPKAGRGNKPVEAPSKPAERTARTAGAKGPQPEAVSRVPDILEPAATPDIVEPGAQPALVDKAVPQALVGETEGIDEPEETASQGKDVSGEPVSRQDLPSFRMREPVDGEAPRRRVEGLDRDQMVERITASLAEMLARALRQSVEQAVEEALGHHPVRAPSEAAGQAVHKAIEQKPVSPAR